MPVRVQAATVSFRTSPAHGRGWSQRELCEIDRVRAACENGPQLAMIGGESDEGDPWCIVCDREGERILLHIARIDCCYVVARPCRAGLRRTTSIATATDLALKGLDRELRRYLRKARAI